MVMLFPKKRRIAGPRVSIPERENRYRTGCYMVLDATWQGMEKQLSVLMAPD